MAEQHLSSTSSNTSKAFSLLTVVGVLLISLNLRSPITGLGPLLDVIREQLHLSSMQAGMLTTLPLLAFAFFSPIAAILGRKRGLEQSLMLALVLILMGIIVRSLGSVSWLFIGTVIIGAGIAIANVLLPSLLKRDFPTKVTTITAVYVLMMGVGSTFSASFAIPVMNMASELSITFIPNWAFALASIIAFPVIAIMFWLPQLKKHSVPTAEMAEIDNHSYLWRSASAWHITIFLALNSLLMYIFVSWLPVILVDYGYSHQEAGFIHGMLQLATAMPAIILIPLMAKIHDKRALTVSMSLLAFIGIAGLIALPSMAIVWVLFFGVGFGGGFILALAFISLRTQSVHQAAALSGMAQCCGYLLAASGPIAIGALHESSGNWLLPLSICAAINVLWSFFALLAAKQSPITPPMQIKK
jgi:CP family cyanate transporter-like MFS transporter